MKLRPPATPILNVDPYFSVWTEKSVFDCPIHWTGRPNTMCGRVFVDGREFHFFGKRTGDVAAMRPVSTDIDAFSTTIVCENDAIRLRVRFTSPLLPDDLYYASRPVVYAKVSYESLDGAAHDVRVRFVATEELVLNLRGEGRALATRVEIDGMSAIRMGNGEQRVLHREGDDLRIDFGYLYLAVCGEGKVDHTVFGGLYGISVEATLDTDALFLFAYDDIRSIRYFGDDLPAYWKKDGKTIEQAMIEAAAEYDSLLARCQTFSDDLYARAKAAGGEKYAELLQLSLRQVMAAHKLVVDTEGNNLYISKECFSNACTATVDVTYPSAPMFLLYNVELLKGMLRPIMRYAASDEWTCDFAPHDVGTYPHVDGQRYCVRRDEYGKVLIDPNGQMPVEECGNMLILFAAICDAEDSTAFVEPHMDTVRQWLKYLIEYGYDPESQLCTDDFAGHLAHNVNLSIKAIMGIAGYARIMARLGEQKESDEKMAIAREYATSLIERAANADGSFRLAYDRPETFSLKYNAVWDKLWGTELFPDSFYRGELARYQKEMLAYGVPLDSRERYTKSDWLVWVASLAESREEFETLLGGLWAAYDTMRTRVPMTDWFYCDTSHMVGFRHRSVQGGLFIKLMFE